VPNAQKSRNLLYACGIPYQRSERLFVRLRNNLTDLGITYRRIPVNSIGKDVYCDTRVFLDAIQSIFADKALPTCLADNAYEALGYRTFWISLPLIPASLITPGTLGDREDLFSVFGRPDCVDLRPNSLAEFKFVLDMLENECLVLGQCINGPECSVADFHTIWIVKWAFQTVEICSEPGFSRDDFPTVYMWIEGLPTHNEQNDTKKISPEEAQEKLLNSDYAAAEISVDPRDATGL